MTILVVVWAEPGDTIPLASNKAGNASSVMEGSEMRCAMGKVGFVNLIQIVKMIFWLDWSQPHTVDALCFVCIDFPDDIVTIGDNFLHSVQWKPFGEGLRQRIAWCNEFRIEQEAKAM